MRTRLILTAAALLAAGALLGWLGASGRLFPEVRAQQQADPAVLVEKIDAAVAAEMKKQKVPGAAVAISARARWRWSKGTARRMSSTTSR